MCAVTVVVWLRNPFAAALLVPALHLWLLALNGDLRVPLGARALLMLAGLLPVAGIALYYAFTLGYGPVDAAWAATLLIAGHVVAPLAVLPWTIFLGCVLSGAAVLAKRSQTCRYLSCGVPLMRDTISGVYRSTCLRRRLITQRGFCHVSSTFA